MQDLTKYETYSQVQKNLISTRTFLELLIARHDPLEELASYILKDIKKFTYDPQSSFLLGNILNRLNDLKFSMTTAESKTETQTVLNLRERDLGIQLLSKTNEQLSPATPIVSKKTHVSSSSYGTVKYYEGPYTQEELILSFDPFLKLAAAVAVAVTDLVPKNLASQEIVRIVKSQFRDEGKPLTLSKIHKEYMMWMNALFTEHGLILSEKVINNLGFDPEQWQACIESETCSIHKNILPLFKTDVYSPGPLGKLSFVLYPVHTDYSEKGFPYGLIKSLDPLSSFLTSRTMMKDLRIPQDTFTSVNKCLNNLGPLVLELKGLIGSLEDETLYVPLISHIMAVILYGFPTKYPTPINNPAYDKKRRVQEIVDAHLLSYRTRIKNFLVSDAALAYGDYVAMFEDTGIDPETRQMVLLVLKISSLCYILAQFITDEFQESVTLNQGLQVIKDIFECKEIAFDPFEEL